VLSGNQRVSRSYFVCTPTKRRARVAGGYDRWRWRSTGWQWASGAVRTSDGGYLSAGLDRHRQRHSSCAMYGTYWDHELWSGRHGYGSTQSSGVDAPATCALVLRADVGWIRWHRGDVVMQRKVDMTGELLHTTMLVPGPKGYGSHGRIPGGFCHDRAHLANGSMGWSKEVTSGFDVAPGSTRRGW
jgi:hypothetical protein